MRVTSLLVRISWQLVQPVAMAEWVNLPLALSAWHSAHFAGSVFLSSGTGWMLAKSRLAPAKRVHPTRTRTTLVTTASKAYVDKCTTRAEAGQVTRGCDREHKPLFDSGLPRANWPVGNAPESCRGGRTGFFPAQPRNPTPRRAGRLDGYHSLRTDSKASFSDFWWAKRISSPVSVVFVLAGPQVLWITAPSPIAPARASVCGEKHGS